jgi:hypothetical protein
VTPLKGCTAQRDTGQILKRRIRSLRHGINCYSLHFLGAYKRIAKQALHVKEGESARDRTLKSTAEIKKFTLLLYQDFIGNSDTANSRPVKPQRVNEITRR